VLLLAASLPGVRVAPFHSDSLALPALPADLWPPLLQQAARVRDQQQQAC
jgi:hypothetical protein